MYKIPNITFARFEGALRRYLCVFGHVSVSFNTNYTTKEQECHKHHCNAPVTEMIAFRTAQDCNDYIDSLGK
jgi:hypothetical protein